MSTLEQQIEAAFHYRGNVTVTLKSGESVEGFLYNREFANQRLAQDWFVDLFLAGSGDPRRLAIADITHIELTGEDCAAGKSYAEWLEKKKLAEAAGEATH